MVKRKLPVINWNTSASQRLRKIYEEILQDSYSNAEKVKNGIEIIIDQLPKHPQKYPLDKFKINNPGNYRAFEKYSLRVTYRHTETEIRILRIRYVKQEPKKF